MFRKISLSGNKPAFLFMAFLLLFLWQVVGLFFADFLNVGIELIFRRLSFLLFPLVLFYPGIKITRNINLIIRLFAVCTFLYIIYCFGNAMHNSLTVKEGRWIFNPYHEDYTYENFFFGARLSDIVHPTYLSMYVLLAILISFEAIYDNSLKMIKRFIWLIISVVFIIVIYLLSSRAGLLAALIVLSLYFILKLYKKISKWIILSVLVILMSGSVVLIIRNSRISYSVEEISKTNLNETLKKDIRLGIWESAIVVIKQNLIVGVGTGDASEELKKEYKRQGYVEGYYDNLNAHNQFLEILLENGLIGLIFFLFILGYICNIAISQQNLLLGLFIIMMAIFFMFETMLNRLAGITFFPFFSFLLLHIKTTPDN